MSVVVSDAAIYFAEWVTVIKSCPLKNTFVMPPLVVLLLHHIQDNQVTASINSRVCPSPICCDPTDLDSIQSQETCNVMS